MAIEQSIGGLDGGIAAELRRLGADLDLLTNAATSADALTMPATTIDE
jgi:hypothetical protein